VEDDQFTLGDGMRSSRALVLGALALLPLAGCAGAGPPPIPPAQIGLQGRDLPAGLSRCPGSGDVDAFARSLPAAGAPARDELLNAWKELQKQGATRAAVTVYAADPAACGTRLGSGPGTTVTSVVVAFEDDEAAAAAYQRGMLGFTTPSEDADVQDMTRGVATGLGRNAWVVERSTAGRSVVVGLWERRAVLVLFMAVDEDPLHAKQALAAVDGRIG
jgi:hypothetical protein